MNAHDERVNMLNHERGNLNLDRGNMSLERSSMNMEDSGDGNLLNEIGGKSNSKDRGDNWGTQETEALIQVWKTHYVSLESITHKRKVYKLVSDRLRELGHDRNIPAVQAKINKLKTLYRKNRPDPATGNKKPKWRFWEAVHEVVLQPLQRQGIRDRIGPAGITRETGPASPSATDDAVAEVTENPTGKDAATNNSEETNAAETPKEKPTRAKKGNTSQARRKLTVRHDEVLKKLLQEEDESHAIVQKLNSSYQETVNNLVQMQKKCNEKLVSLMTTFESHLNATQPQPASPAPSRPLSNSSTSHSSSPYPPTMNASPHQHQQFPNRSSHGSGGGGGLPQHFQRAQSHFPQSMASCRPPSMLYQQQQPPPMMQPPPLPMLPTPPLNFPSWNPMNIQSDTLIALLFPNLRMALHSLPNKEENEQNSSIKDPDEEIDAVDSD